MNPLSNERDAFRALLLVVVGAIGVGAAGALGDGWTALATFLALVAGVVVGVWIGKQNAGDAAEPQIGQRVRGLPILVVAPVELAGPMLAREVAAEEGATFVRAVLLAPEDELATAGRAAAELRALLEELNISAQVICVASGEAEKAVAAELRDGVLSHVFVATHRADHPAFPLEEELVHAIDAMSRPPVVAVSFSAR